MADDFSPEEVWDEYKWEAFLQEQDRNTEKYFTLLEKYMDHPDRDDLIAQEMGWDLFSGTENEEIGDLLCQEEKNGAEEKTFDEFVKSPVYKETLKLHRWIDAWLDTNESLKDNPEVLRFATRSTICGAKLAAALCGDDSTEIGMTIAYLKRAMKAANGTLDSVAHLSAQDVLNDRQLATARRLIFRIRDRIVDLMGHYRAEWRKRHGAD